MSLGVLSAKRRVLSALVALTMPLLVVLAPAAHAQSAPQPGDPKSGKHRLHAAAEPRHDVPNRLLKEQFSEEEEEDSNAVRLYQSVYETALRNQIPRPVIDDIIRIYSYDVDFQRRAQPGDSFEVLYAGDDEPAAQRLRRHRLHKLRRRPDLDQRRAAAPGLPDRRVGPTVLYGRRGRPGHRVRPAQHGVLRDAGVQPGRGARHPAARERHRGVRLA